MTRKLSDLAVRMKAYESASRISLTPRLPMIIRVDGKAFHTYTRGMDAPWDLSMRSAMTAAAMALVDEIQGASFAYIQSDEISVLSIDYRKFSSCAWFDKAVQKVVSVSASIATAAFNADINRPGKPALFDSRAFVLPREEVCNYFVWRQQDATRNSISGLAQRHFSHRELRDVNTDKMQDLLMTKHAINWNDCEAWQKRGWTVRRQVVDTGHGPPTLIAADYAPPIFTAGCGYVDTFIYPSDEEGR